ALASLTLMPTCSARVSTDFSPWHNRSMSSRRRALPMALPMRATCSYNGFFESCMPIFYRTLEYWHATRRCAIRWLQASPCRYAPRPPLDRTSSGDGRPSLAPHTDEETERVQDHQHGHDPREGPGRRQRHEDH